MSEERSHRFVLNEVLPVGTEFELDVAALVDSQLAEGSAATSIDSIEYELRCNSDGDDSGAVRITYDSLGGSWDTSDADVDTFEFGTALFLGVATGGTFSGFVAADGLQVVRKAGGTAMPPAPVLLDALTDAEPPEGWEYELVAVTIGWTEVVPPHVIVEVFDPTNTTLVQRITVPGTSVEWHQVRALRVGHERNRVFDCWLDIDLDHPHIDALTKNRVVRVTEDGVITAPWRIANRKPTSRSKEGHRGRTMRVSGKTLAGDFEGSVIEPASGTDAKPVSPDRVENFATLDLNTTGWGASYSQDSIWDDGEPYDRPNRWSEPFSQWIYTRAAASAHPKGRGYLRSPASGEDAFTLSETTNCLVFFSADDAAKVYIDGDFLGETQNSDVDNWLGIKNWMETFGEPIQLAAGTHVIAAEVFNQGFPPVGTRAGFICAVWSVDAEGFLDTPVYLSSPDWIGLDYPDDPPAPEVGRVLRRYIAESQARDELEGWTTSFTNTHDSNGEPWPKPEMVFRASVDTVWTALERYGQVWCDWDTDEEGLVLDAYVKDTEPVDSGVSWTSGVDVVELSRDDGDLPVNSVHVRWERGIEVVDDAASVAEFGVKRSRGIVQTQASQAAALAIAGHELAVDAWPAESVTFEVPNIEGKRPWGDLRPNQTASLDGDDLVVSGLVSEFGRNPSGGGRLVTAVQASSLQEERRYRQQRMIAAIEAGFDSGATSATPLDRGFKAPSGQRSDTENGMLWTWGQYLAEAFEEVDPEEDPEDIGVWQPFPISDPCRLWRWEMSVSGDQEAYGDSKLILLYGNSDGSPPLIAGAPLALFILTLGPTDVNVGQRIWGPGALKKPQWVMPGLIADGGHVNGSVRIYATDPA